tara:strand:+ start:1034 stop:1147 length:114 start_codon:yes stop_codon:yes gene_type:complete
MFNEYIDIIIGNLLFWPLYGYLCALPQILMQKVIDKA